MNIKKAALLSFEELLDIEYRVVVGRKNKETELIIGFNKEHLFHLVGLQKLDDLSFPTENKEKMFDLIMEEQITDSFLSKSSKYETTNLERIIPFINIEKIMDSNNLVFKFNRSQSNWTSIDCKFILENRDSGESIYIFIDGNYELQEKMFCKSFFIKAQKDFTKGNKLEWPYYLDKIK